MASASQGLPHASAAPMPSSVSPFAALGVSCGPCAGQSSVSFGGVGECGSSRPTASVLGLCGGVGDPGRQPPGVQSGVPLQGQGCGLGGTGVPMMGQGQGQGNGGGQGDVPPTWLSALLTQQESVRSVELPPLNDLGEAEIGPLLAGDWLTSITPLMRDISPSSSQWWDLVLQVAGSKYQAWLSSDPLSRLRIQPANPPEFERAPLLRVEQRGQAVPLKALPESLRSEIIANRALGSTQIIFRVLTRYQPGGLAERTTLLKQLVDVKAPANVSGVTTSLRSWKRWLVRIGELGITPPDATLFDGSLG